MVMGIMHPICAMHASVSPLQGCSCVASGIPSVPAQSIPVGMAWLASIAGASAGPPA